MEKGQSVEVRITPLAEKDIKNLCKKYPHLQDDLDLFYGKLAAKPYVGDPFGPGNKYCKIRLAISDLKKGASGGLRVYTAPTEHVVYIFWVIQKAADEGLKHSDRLRELIRRERLQLQAE